MAGKNGVRFSAKGSRMSRGEGCLGGTLTRKKRKKGVAIFNGVEKLEWEKRGMSNRDLADCQKREPTQGLPGQQKDSGAAEKKKTSLKRPERKEDNQFFTDNSQLGGRTNEGRSECGWGGQ